MTNQKLFDNKKKLRNSNFVDKLLNRKLYYNFKNLISVFQKVRNIFTQRKVY